MFHGKKMLATAMFILFIQTMQAQPHYNAWFRGTLSIPVDKNIKIDTEYLHRRQNGFGNNNMFDNNLMFAVINWVHYQHNEDVKFSLSPFAYFSNYKIIREKSDETAKPVSEIRFSGSVELQNAILKKFYIVNRTALEYRNLESIRDIMRLRNRFGFRYVFTEKVRFGIYDEILINLTGTTAEHNFDHNRIGFNFEYKVLPNFKIDFGYIYIVRLPIKSYSKIYENNFSMNVTYQLNKRTKKRSNQRFPGIEV